MTEPQKLSDVLTVVPDIPPRADEAIHAARHVLGFFDVDGGYKPGHFTTRLIEAYLYADLDNRAKIEEGWPALGFVLRVWSSGGESAVSELIDLLEAAEEDDK